jgi:predicted RNA methylase
MFAKDALWCLPGMNALRLSRFDRWPRWWTYGGLKVHYRRHLNGGGTWLAPPFVEFVKRRYAGRRFRRIYEWCAGPSFIGFALLSQGIADELYLSDINPDAIASVRKTIARNRLDGRVHAFCGSGVAALPAGVEVDLVVGNPPNFFSLNPDHPQTRVFRFDLRAADDGWAIHREFYAGIRRHLAEDAVVLISEISPFAQHVFIPGIDAPYDVRLRPAVDDFREMIEAGGLRYEGTYRYVEGPGITAEVMVSRPNVTS